MSGYHPSVFLLCTLIFWTGLSAIAEVIIPFDAILFAIITYAPTLHFATQAIVRRSVGGVQAKLDTRKAARGARLLTLSWVLNVGGHVGLWWTYRRDMWPEVFLLPVFPGIQAVLVVMSIAFRYTIDRYMMEREERLRVARDGEEGTSAETAALLQADRPARNDENISLHQGHSEPAIETTASASASPPAVPLYQPSIPLLLISISLLLCTLVLDIQDHSKQSTQSLAIVASIQTYIPTILLHSYIFLQILRKDSADALQRSTVIAGLSFDLIPLWLGTRGFMAYMQYSRSLEGVRVDPVRMVPGGVEVFLAVYFAARYTRSVYAERRRRIGMGIMEDDLGGPSDNLETQPTIDPLIISESTPFYRPSPILLVISVILSTACLIIESLAEPVCGVPMSAIVYAPTILIHLHLLYQHYRRPNPSPNPSPSTTPNALQEFTTSMERALQLCLIWLLTQAFYVFVWPVSQYLEREVMNPWVRSSEVVVIIYLAVRYVGDRELRSSGGIRLPPDVEEGDTPAGERSSAEASP